LRATQNGHGVANSKVRSIEFRNRARLNSSRQLPKAG
jgi:hypothetical protein